MCPASSLNGVTPQASVLSTVFLWYIISLGALTPLRVFSCYLYTLITLKCIISHITFLRNIIPIYPTAYCITPCLCPLVTSSSKYPLLISLFSLLCLLYSSVFEVPPSSQGRRGRVILFFSVTSDVFLQILPPQ